jgi:hypothetical protein
MNRAKKELPTLSRQHPDASGNGCISVLFMRRTLVRRINLFVRWSHGA